MSLRKLLVNVAALALLTVPAFAADGWEHNSEYNKLFNTKTTQTVSGKIVKVDRHYSPLKGMQPGFMAVIQPGTGDPMEVQIGPEWFTSFFHSEWKVKVGDVVTVTGPVVNVGGHSAMMVVQGQKDEHKMTLRNKQGWPVWDLEVADF